MPIIDPSGDGVGGPAVHAYSILPSDTADLIYLPRAIYVGSTGNVIVTMLGGETVTILAVPTGSILPIRPTRVFATGTTGRLLGEMLDAPVVCLQSGPLGGDQ